LFIRNKENQRGIECSFKIKDLGELKYLLGLEVARSNKGIHLCHRKYSIDILAKTGMLGSKPCTTPLMSNNKTNFEDVKKLQNPEPYSKLIGKLLYLANTRPNITFGVHLLSQLLQEPIIHHQQAIQCILRYIIANPAKGLIFSS